MSWVATFVYPSMLLATTGVPAAIASRSTTPNDSPRSDGAQNTRARFSRSTFSASLIRPSHSTRVSEPNLRLRSAVSGPSEATQSATSAGRCSSAPRSTPRPFRGSWRPMKNTAFSRGSSAPE